MMILRTSETEDMAILTIESKFSKSSTGNIDYKTNEDTRASGTAEHDENKARRVTGHINSKIYLNLSLLQYLPMTKRQGVLQR